jgi:lipid-A-disaccharide synthase-like uncharacterized protein
MFTGRFIVQWLSSERNKRVTIPVAFWLLSICGSLLLLAYAIHKRDLVFTIGQSSGLFIYLRNLQLTRSESQAKQRLDQEATGSAGDADSQARLPVQHNAA